MARWQGLAALLLVALLTGACLTRREDDSEWPPEDFRLLVDRGSYVAPTEGALGGRVSVQRFRVWPDGTVLYAEGRADGLRVRGLEPLPLLDRVCVYRLHPKSLRILSRRVGRLDEAGVTLDPQALDDIQIEWAGFGKLRILGVTQRPGRVPTRVLRTVNAFLPRNAGFEHPRLGGEPDATRVEMVPEPAVGTAAALEGFRVLIARLDALEAEGSYVGPMVTADVLEAAVALAVAEKRVGLLREWFDRIEDRYQSPQTFPDGVPYLNALRQLVESIEADGG